MSHAVHPLRGPLFMIVAAGAFVANDTMMKLATESLPPYQVLTMRGIAAFAWGMPALLLLGYGRRLAQVFDTRVLLRNLLEMAGVLCFVVALVGMSIADVTALLQITPVLMLIGAAFLFGERIRPLTLALIFCGLAGALMVAQPSASGVSPVVLLAFAAAAFGAGRDLASRGIAPEIPGLIVALSAVIVVLAGSTLCHLLLEEWKTPELKHVLLLAGSGFFLNFGHFFLFMAYRVGPTSAVAPFFYAFSVWAVVSGLVVFGELPDALAAAGIVLIVGSGLAIVLHDRWRRRLVPIA
jgi:drug/metabolite transporter (DMT)-like permease